jgi:hypothetical protein
MTAFLFEMIADMAESLKYTSGERKVYLVRPGEAEAVVN